MPAPDKFEKRRKRLEKQKELRARIASEDDAPIPDAPVEQAKKAQSVGRNDPCPCGSGRKYKKCCGKVP